MNRTISTVVIVALAISCTTSVPPARLAATETAVQSARDAGAERVAEANKHLQMAEQELAEARMLDAEGKPSAAEAMLRRADSDAALAAALSDEARQKKAGTEDETDRVRAKQPPKQSPKPGPKPGQ